MRPNVGNRVVVDGHHVGARRREGDIVEILPGARGERLRVRWEGGGESILSPASDCVIVPAPVHPATAAVTPANSAPATPGAPAQDRAVDLRGRTHIRTTADMEFWFDEDDTHTEARVTISLRDFEVTGFGRAQRHPHDPNLPAVGEELSAARAMSDLAHQLLDLATYQIEKREGHAIVVRL